MVNLVKSCSLLLMLVVIIAVAWGATQVIQAAPDLPSPVKPAVESTKSGLLTIDPAELQKPWQGDLDGMIERRVIRVLTVNSKTFYFVDKGTQRGSVVDFFRVFEEQLNKQLSVQNKLKHKHLKVRVAFVPVSRDQLLPSLVEGRGDVVAANLTITPERRQIIDFTEAVMSDVSEVLVSGPASPEVSSLEGLSGKQVFVRRSSSYYQSLLALNQRLTAAGMAPVQLKLAPEVLEDEDLLEMLNAGLVPLLVVDNHKARFWKQIFPALTVHEDIVLRSGGQVAWALRKNSPQLKQVLDDFVRQNRIGSSLGNQVLTRYLKNTKYVKNAASEAERQKFLSLIQYFQKYGDQYKVDWLLMQAQGYQESKLDQNAKSAVGAIGVMQLMPATGKDMQVGDIHQTEVNIHAGIKYMRWMIDNYYDKEPMKAQDKALFAFASYNAGPRRVISLRKEAARRGLDPNVWFHNVEYVAAEKVGQETVTYVSNIYKYYIAYHLLMDSRQAQREAREALQRPQP